MKLQPGKPPGEVLGTEALKLPENWRPVLEIAPTVQDLFDKAMQEWYAENGRELGPVPPGSPLNSMQGRFYWENFKAERFAKVITDLEPADRVLVVSAGGAVRDPGRLDEAIVKHQPQAIVFLRDFYTVHKEKLLECLEDGIRVYIFDSEIDPQCWYAFGYPAEPIPFKVIFHCRRAWLEGWIEPKDVYWFFQARKGMPSFEAERGWKRSGNWCPYQSSGEAGLYVALKALEPKVVGLLGYQADTDGYRWLAKYIVEILEAHPNVEFTDYSGRGVVFDWIQERRKC